MKIFVFSKNNMLFFGTLIVALIGMMVARSNGYTDVVNASARLLPIYSVETDEKCVAITFDSAWGDEDTQKILDALAKNNAKATFFVTGDYLDRCSVSAKAFFDAGHEIANHSNVHPHPNKLSEIQLKEDTKKCEEKIFAITGKPNNLYRAPYGEYNNDTVSAINSMGYYFIQWDADSLDYKNLSDEQICERILKRVKNGSIILFHTGTQNTAAALEKLLPKLCEMGYSFKSVGELIYKDGFDIDNSGRQIKNVS